MLEAIAAVLARLRPGAVDDDADSTAVERTTAAGRKRADGGTGASLFQCESCGTVYIATDKRQCAGCEAPVEPVSPAGAGGETR